MLILSRKVGEKINIGDGITVVVQRVSGDRVTLGLEAPSDVRILRSELRPYPQRFTPELEPVAVGVASPEVPHPPRRRLVHNRLPR